MRSVRVALGPRSYVIGIGRGLLEGLGGRCARLGLARRCAVVSDTNVSPRYGEKVLASLRVGGFDPCLVCVPAGERSKSLRQVSFCYDRLAAHRLERRSFVVALGGGVVGDLAGFVAATYLRGIPFVQVPTTLLAQVDSSVGGKVGVNLRAGKNLVGAFWQPLAVWCDLGTLGTLAEREYRAGLAEVIKYGIIQDAPFFRFLERSVAALLRREPGTLGRVVARCCAIKAAVVAQDETETGRRAILNFGHTVGHALEAVLGYGRLLHGEAIAIGQVLAARLSTETTGLPTKDAERIEALFRRVGLPTRLRLNGRQRDRVLEAMRHDKKVSGGRIRFVLAERIGQVRFGAAIDPDRVESLLAGAAT